MITKSHPNNKQTDVLRAIVLPVLAIGFLLVLSWFVASVGWGSLMTTYAARSNRLSAAETAVRLGPRNADAHYVRAIILEASNLRGAVAEHREAVKDRPQDYALWLSLARAAELNGDTALALNSAQHAIPLAPFYSQPHYQLGNILLRSGRAADGFAELRAAAESDPALMPGIIDLAWRLSRGDVRFVEQALAPTSPEARLALAQYFRAGKQYEPAVRLYAGTGAVGARDRENYVAELLRNSQFRQAATLWQVDHPHDSMTGNIEDRGFETEMDLSQKGFGWQAAEKTEGVRFALDLQAPEEGKSSLKIEFSGAAGVPSPIISQLILIEPNSRYRLRFFSRSEGIVSAGLPYVSILEGKSKNRLNKSPSFARTSDGWQEYTLEFTTSPEAESVVIALERESCVTSPCPIFGQVWLDNFSLAKL